MSFKAFSEYLKKQSQSEILKKELDMWQTKAWDKSVSLPVDFKNGENTVDSICTLDVSLSRDETQSLLYEVPKEYHAQIGDLILTALAEAFREWTKNEYVLLDMEGHGREWEVDGIDLSRTTGWFTTLFPVLLYLESSEDHGENIRFIKEQMRKIPSKGSNYGVLHYISENTDIKSVFKKIPQPEIMFNYLGQTDQIFNQSLIWENTMDFIGPHRSPKQKRRYIIEINALISNGILDISWSYSNNLYHETTITELAERFLNLLKMLISYCLTNKAGGYVPSDFPDVDLSQEELLEALNEINL